MGEQQYRPPESREIRWTSPVAFGDANYNNHDENHCFCYYNWAVTKALEFASGHLETGAKSVNMDLEPRVATGLDLRNGAAGGYNFPLPTASPTSRDPKGHHPPQSFIFDSSSKLCVPRALGYPRPPRPRDPTSQKRPREDGCVSVCGASWALRRPGMGPRRARERGPVARRALGEGSASPSRHAGRGAVSPGGQRPRSAAFRPPRSWNDDPGHLPPTEEGSESPMGSILARGPHPTALLPAHSQTPRLTLSRIQVARGAHQQRGHSHQQRRGGRPPPAPRAHGCGSPGPGGSERAAPACGGHAPRRPPGGR